MNVLQHSPSTWYWTPMGREGSLLREVTKTKEMALAWLFRGALTAVVILGTGLIGLSVYIVTDLRTKSEQAWLAGDTRMTVIEQKQSTIASDMAVLRQIIADRIDSRDREIRDIDRRLDALERAK